MRVLVVDQDITMLERVSRLLGDAFSVDTVSSKASCLDLLRQNDFELVIATERLSDGSGLELLGQIGQRWPHVRRIFAADAQRLALLAHRLAPFALFRTVAYPLDADELMEALVAAHQEGKGETGSVTVEHVELGSEPEPAPTWGATSAAAGREPARAQAPGATTLAEARAAALSGLALAQHDPRRGAMTARKPVSVGRAAARPAPSRGPPTPAARAPAVHGSALGIAVLAVLCLAGSAGIVLLRHSVHTSPPRPAVPPPLRAAVAPPAASPRSGTLERPSQHGSRAESHRSRTHARTRAPAAELAGAPGPAAPLPPEDFGPPRPARAPAPPADTFSGRTLEQSEAGAPRAADGAR